MFTIRECNAVKWLVENVKDTLSDGGILNVLNSIQHKVEGGYVSTITENRVENLELLRELGVNLMSRYRDLSVRDPETLTELKRECVGLLANVGEMRDFLTFENNRAEAHMGTGLKRAMMEQMMVPKSKDGPGLSASFAKDNYKTQREYELFQQFQLDVENLKNTVGSLYWDLERVYNSITQDISTANKAVKFN